MPECVDRIDGVVGMPGQCLSLLHVGGYDCARDFCPTCPGDWAGKCDYACGYGICSRCGDCRLEGFYEEPVNRSALYGAVCDDGNARSGDGCDEFCTVEPEWTCERVSLWSLLPYVRAPITDQVVWADRCERCMDVPGWHDGQGFSCSDYELLDVCTAQPRPLDKVRVGGPICWTPAVFEYVLVDDVFVREGTPLVFTIDVRSAHDVYVFLGEPRSIGVEFVFGENGGAETAVYQYPSRSTLARWTDPHFDGTSLGAFWFSVDIDGTVSVGRGEEPLSDDLFNFTTNASSFNELHIATDTGVSGWWDVRLLSGSWRPSFQNLSTKGRSAVNACCACGGGELNTWENFFRERWVPPIRDRRLAAMSQTTVALGMHTVLLGSVILRFTAAGDFEAYMWTDGCADAAVSCVLDLVVVPVRAVPMAALWDATATPLSDMWAQLASPTCHIHGGTVVLNTWRWMAEGCNLVSGRGYALAMHLRGSVQSVMLVEFEVGSRPPRALEKFSILDLDPDPRRLSGQMHLQVASHEEQNDALQYVLYWGDGDLPASPDERSLVGFVNAFAGGGLRDVSNNYCFLNDCGWRLVPVDRNDSMSEPVFYILLHRITNDRYCPGIEPLQLTPVLGASCRWQVRKAAEVGTGYIVDSTIMQCLCQGLGAGGGVYYSAPCGSSELFDGGFRGACKWTLFPEDPRHDVVLEVDAALNPDLGSHGVSAEPMAAIFEIWQGVPVWRLHANATLEFDKPFGPLADRSFALWVGLEANADGSSVPLIEHQFFRTACENGTLSSVSLTNGGVTQSLAAPRQVVWRLGTARHDNDTDQFFDSGATLTWAPPDEVGKSPSIQWFLLASVTRFDEPNATGRTLMYASTYLQQPATIMRRQAFACSSTTFSGAAAWVIPGCTASVTLAHVPRHTWRTCLLDVSANFDPLGTIRIESITVRTGTLALDLSVSDECRAGAAGLTYCVRSRSLSELVLAAEASTTLDIIIQVAAPDDDVEAIELFTHRGLHLEGEALLTCSGIYEPSVHAQGSRAMLQMGVAQDSCAAGVVGALASTAWDDASIFDSAPTVLLGQAWAWDRALSDGDLEALYEATRLRYHKDYHAPVVQQSEPVQHQVRLTSTLRCGFPGCRASARLPAFVASANWSCFLTASIAVTDFSTPHEVVQFIQVGGINVSNDCFPRAERRPWDRYVCVDRVALPDGLVWSDAGGVEVVAKISEEVNMYSTPDGSLLELEIALECAANGDATQAGGYDVVKTLPRVDAMGLNFYGFGPSSSFNFVDFGRGSARRLANVGFAPAVTYVMGDSVGVSMPAPGFEGVVAAFVAAPGACRQLTPQHIWVDEVSLWDACPSSHRRRGAVTLSAFLEDPEIRSCTLKPGASFEVVVYTATRFGPLNFEQLACVDFDAPVDVLASLSQPPAAMPWGVAFADVGAEPGWIQGTVRFNRARPETVVEEYAIFLGSNGSVVGTALAVLPATGASTYEHTLLGLHLDPEADSLLVFAQNRFGRAAESGAVNIVDVVAGFTALPRVTCSEDSGGLMHFTVHSQVYASPTVAELAIAFQGYEALLQPLANGSGLDLSSAGTAVVCSSAPLPSGTLTPTITLGPCALPKYRRFVMVMHLTSAQPCACPEPCRCEGALQTVASADAGCDVLIDERGSSVLVLERDVPPVLSVSCGEECIGTDSLVVSTEVISPLGAYPVVVRCGVCRPPAVSGTVPFCVLPREASVPSRFWRLGFRGMNDSACLPTAVSRVEFYGPSSTDADGKLLKGVSIWQRSGNSTNETLDDAPVELDDSDFVWAGLDLGIGASSFALWARARLSSSLAGCSLSGITLASSPDGYRWTDVRYGATLDPVDPAVVHLFVSMQQMTGDSETMPFQRAWLSEGSQVLEFRDATPGSVYDSWCLAEDVLGNTAVPAALRLQTNCEPGFAALALNGTGGCTECIAGRFSEGGGASVCSVCTAGRFSASNASSSCDVCGAGTFSPEGSVGCTVCPTGQAAKVESGSCTVCGLGWAPSAPDRAVCELCLEGRYSDVSDSDFCDECPLGTFAFGLGTVNCTECSPGRFANVTGASECLVCALGTYSDSGSEVCEECDSGFSAPVGSSSCTECLAGRFSDGSMADCEACLPGRFSSVNGSSTCAMCHAGTYSGVEATICGACAPGRFALAGAPVCTLCGNGTFSLSGNGNSSCTACASGWYAAEGSSSCTACLGGTAVGPLRESCVVCEAGDFAPNASDSCSSCASGTVSTAGRDHCDACTAGRYASGNQTACLDCPEGTSSGARSDACDPCPTGYVSPSGSSSCTLCLAGTIPDLALTNCVPCEAGRFAATSGCIECTICPNGTASTGGSSSCPTCPAGRFADEGSALCERCLAGRAAGAGSSFCELCTAGRAAAAESEACTICPAGTSTEDEAASCSPCAAGKHAPHEESDSCDLCNGGRFSTGGSNGSVHCEFCGLGQYAPLGSAWCLLCPVGRFSFGANATECEPCNAGRSATVGGIGCYDCAAGRFAKIGDRHGCSLCSPGRSSAEGFGGVGSPPQPMWYECNPGYTLNGQATARVYDGHGAISAGAASRLLYDYEEPLRSQILDWLFLPKFGASFHVLKLEVGSDSHTGTGVEPSHMHHRDDLSCNRGFQFWLMTEALRRNPDLVVFAIADAVPGWVGGPEGSSGGFYSSDLIGYLMSWLHCVYDVHNGTVHYLSFGNERGAVHGAVSYERDAGKGHVPYMSFGVERGPVPPVWMVQFRSALDDANFTAVRLVASGGHFDEQVLVDARADLQYASSVAGGAVGIHRPCFAPRSRVEEAGFKYWASEDGGVFGDWDGTGCWGRTMNYNFVRMNMTSTLARSLVWSVYSPVSQPGTGFVDAFEPWSGRYMVRGPVWATAHTTHFVDVGWLMLDTNKGSAGRLWKGGTFVTFVPPERDGRFVVVIEKLDGNCTECQTEVLGPEQVTFTIVGGLGARNGSVMTKLGLWSTNETNQFLRLPDLDIDHNGTFPSFSFMAGLDSIYTVATLTDDISKYTLESSSTVELSLASGAYPTQRFPDVLDDFDGYLCDASPRFFADFGGSWQVHLDPDADLVGENLVLKQWVADAGGSNAWLQGVPPMTLVGDSFTDVSVIVDVYLPPAASVYQRSDGRRSDFNESVFQSSSIGSCLAALRKYGYADGGPRLGLQDCESNLAGNLRLDSNFGILHDGDRKWCVGVGDLCGPLAAETDLCLTLCAAVALHDDFPTLNWSLHPSGTLRWEPFPDLCLTAVGNSDGENGARMVLQPCGGIDGIVNFRQHWQHRQLSERTAGVCLRLSPPRGLDRKGRALHRQGYCLTLGAGADGRGQWYLSRDAEILISGFVGRPTGTWHTLSLVAQGPVFQIRVDELVASVVDTTRTQGMAALVTGWNEAFFDNFALRRIA